MDINVEPKKLASGLLALVTHSNWSKEGGYRFYWLLLTGLFLFLTFDEP